MKVRRKVTLTILQGMCERKVKNPDLLLAPAPEYCDPSVEEEGRGDDEGDHPHHHDKIPTHKLHQHRQNSFFLKDH